MALFEFEGGRLVPAQFGRQIAGGLTRELIEAVCSQLLEIVSRPLFPITWRDMSRMAGPSEEGSRLTALDATGQIVSVEVVELLDSDTLIASLSRLADTASLSWADLAREYPGDLDAFKAGWLRFRDSMPPSPGAGPRLIMVVGAVDPSVRPALDVLAASGVEVHEMSLRQMSNGRCFLDVQTVGRRLYGHAPQVLLGRSGGVPALTLSLDGGEHPELPQGESMVCDMSTVEDFFAATENEGGVEESLQDNVVLTSAEQGEEKPQWQEEVACEASSVSADASASVTAAPSSVLSEDPISSETNESPEVTRARAEGVPLLDRDAGGLQTLAQIIAEDVPLHISPLLGLPEGAVLAADGSLLLLGQAHEDPVRAMASIGRPDLDGWRQWRLVDDQGPTLAESIDEINREIVREYRRVPLREHRSRH